MWELKKVSDVVDAILLNSVADQTNSGTYLDVDLYIIPNWKSAKYRIKILFQKGDHQN